MVEEWQARHENPEIDFPIEDPEINTVMHRYCVSAAALGAETAHDHNNSVHLNVGFLSRKCWGTKENYMLLNPQYRKKPEAWAWLDANLSVEVHNGKIKKIVVDYPGDNYFAPSLVVEGSGSGVVGIPVYNDGGTMTDVLFDDPDLTNTHFDTHIVRPSGAGQGFRERPWSWDTAYDSVSSPQEKLFIYRKAADGGKEWSFGTPTLADNQGDRILSVDVNESGLYSNTADLETASINFNTSVSISGFGLIDFNQTDFDGDGHKDFSHAKIRGIADFKLKKFRLDGDGTFLDWTEVDKAKTPRGLFTEQPSIELLDGRNLSTVSTLVVTMETLEGGREVITKQASGSSPFTLLGDSTAGNFPFLEENASQYIRLNGNATYDAEQDLNYIELYIDDRFPQNLYYGIGQITDLHSDVLPEMGGEILISEGLPGQDWNIAEPAEKKYFSLTDENGYYAVSGLEPGLYTVSVFMEDEKYQDVTFRPDSNTSRISHLLYVPGFPELILETDNYGAGKSSLVWSQEARQLSRIPGRSEEEEYDLEYRDSKWLHGIGRGFDPDGLPPVLSFIPDPGNFGNTVPRVNVQVLVDGSLALSIIDDENTSTFFPNDRFTVRYESMVSGVDFYQSYKYAETNKTFNSGVRASWLNGISEPRLIIFPDDANGKNPV